MSKPKNAGLTRRASGLMALEQRFMFDGAGVGEAVEAVILAMPESVMAASPPSWAAVLSSCWLTSSS